MGRLTARRLRVTLALVLLVLYPVAWMAPLLRAGLLPLFGMSEISVLSGIESLWATDPFLALIVLIFAIVAPYVKLALLLAAEVRRPGPFLAAATAWIGRIAMADIFLVALYVAVAKGIGVGRVETGWGLYLFTFCVLSALALGVAHPTRRP